jgi:hypothetical protein
MNPKGSLEKERRKRVSPGQDEIRWCCSGYPGSRRRGPPHAPTSVRGPTNHREGSSIWRIRTLFLSAVIVFLVLRTRPLPHVAQHVVKPEGVGFETARRSRLLAIPTAAAAITVGVVPADPIPPVAGCRCPGPCCVFPLRLGRQTKTFPGAVVELLDERTPEFKPAP